MNISGSGLVLLSHDPTYSLAPIIWMRSHPLARVAGDRSHWCCLMGGASDCASGSHAGMLMLCPLRVESSAAPTISQGWDVALPGCRTQGASLEGNLLYGGCAPVSTTIPEGADRGLRRRERGRGEVGAQSAPTPLSLCNRGTAEGMVPRLLFYKLSPEVRGRYGRPEQEYPVIGAAARQVCCACGSQSMGNADLEGECQG